MITLDGNEYQFKIPEKIAKGQKHHKKSKGHSTAKKILKELYPLSQVYEEIPIIINENKTLYIDLYLPTLGLMVEVNGRQHYEHTSHFHKSKLDYLKAKQNDELKKQFCELNNIRLVILPYDKQKEWRDLLDN